MQILFDLDYKTWNSLPCGDGNGYGMTDGPIRMDLYYWQTMTSSQRICEIGGNGIDDGERILGYSAIYLYTDLFCYDDGGSNGSDDGGPNGNGYGAGDCIMMEGLMITSLHPDYGY